MRVDLKGGPVMLVLQVVHGLEGEGVVVRGMCAGAGGVGCDEACQRGVSGWRLQSGWTHLFLSPFGCCDGDVVDT